MDFDFSFERQEVNNTYCDWSLKKKMWSLEVGMQKYSEFKRCKELLRLTSQPRL